MAFKMKGSPFHNMESNAQQRKNLMSDDPIGSQASALNKMDPMHNGKPGVQKEDFEQFSSPMNQGYPDRYNKKGESQSDILDKRTANRNNYVTNKHNKTKFTSEETLASSMKNIANYEKLQKKSQDSINSVNINIDKKIAKLKNTPKVSPMNQGQSQGQKVKEINKLIKDNRSIPSDASSKTKRKAKKANKTINQISKLQKKRSSVKTIYEDTDTGPSTRAVKVRSADSNPGSKEKRKTKKLLKTLKQVKGSSKDSPVNQGKITDRPGIKSKKKTSKIQIAKTESSKPQQSSNPSNIKGQQKSKFGIGVSKLKSQVKKKKSPLDNKENRAEVKAAKEGKSGKEKRQAAKAVRKQQRSEGKRGVKKTVTQVKKVVDKVKDSKVYKVGKGIADTVSNVKKLKLAAAIKSGKQTVADAKA